jgi:hypothetical protein
LTLLIDYVVLLVTFRLLCLFDPFSILPLVFIQFAFINGIDRILDVTMDCNVCRRIAANDFVADSASLTRSTSAIKSR